jgi:glycosyltransferase involved in cell wall biosynthesis
MPRLSVYMMVQNEEKRIRNALESVRDIADEIVIIDGGSTDRTTEICREYTDRIIMHPFEGYARQRQFALTQVTGEWVLALDADETLSPELRDAIPKLIGQPTIDAFEFSRRNYVKPGVWLRYGGMYPDYQRRLFRRSKARYGETVHLGEVPEIVGKVERINLDIIHDQIDNNIQYDFKKLMSFVRAEARETRRARVRAFYLTAAFFYFFFVFVKKFFFQQGFRMGMLGVRVAASHALLRFLVNINLAFRRSDKKLHDD